MSTEQMYYGKDCHANNSELSARSRILAESISAVSANQGALLIPQTYGEHYRSPLTINSNAFIDQTSDLRYLLEMREAIRAWFCCYLPEDVNERVHGPGVERGSELYQDIDQFLSSLMAANI